MKRAERQPAAGARRWPHRYAPPGPSIHSLRHSLRAPPHCRNRVRLPPIAAARRRRRDPRSKLAGRDRQAGQAPAPPGRPGDRRLRHDRGRRQGHGLPVGRQGQLRAARHPAGAARSARRCAFEIVAVNLDQKQPGFPDARAARVPRRARGVPFHIERAGHLLASSSASIPEGKTMCSLCSRLRRGILYRVASELGATKIALGHHRDDMLADVLPEHVLRRPAEGACRPSWSATTAARRDPAAGLRRRDRPRALGRAARASRSFRAPCAAARTTCSASRSSRCCATGSASTRAASTTSSTAMGDIMPSHLMDRNLYPVRHTPSHRRGRRRGRPGVRRRRSVPPPRPAGRSRWRAALGAVPTPAASTERFAMKRCASPRCCAACSRWPAARRCTELDADVSSLQPLAGRPRARAPTRSSACRRSRRNPQHAAGAGRRGAARGRGGRLRRPPAGRHGADVSVQIGARITATDRSPFDDPFWYGATARSLLPAVRTAATAAATGGRTPARYWRPTGWSGYWDYYDPVLRARGRGADPRQAERRAALRGARQQRRHYVRADDGLLPAMFSAALQDFPNGGPSNPRRVRVDTTTLTPGAVSRSPLGGRLRRRRRRPARAGRPR